MEKVNLNLPGQLFVKDCLFLSIDPSFRQNSLDCPIWTDLDIFEIPVANLAPPHPESFWSRLPLGSSIGDIGRIAFGSGAV